MSDKLISLDPIIPQKPKVLILGSMPSALSLEKQQYYGNPRNHFWPILYELFSQKPLMNYDEKVSFVKQQGIALWDVIAKCYRKGSLDSNIVEEEPNEIVELLDYYSTIRLIACNGTKAFQTFKKHIILPRHTHIEVIKLPSSSPIPGRYTKTFTGKVKEWEQILAYE